jgi:hypothetical protein
VCTYVCVTLTYQVCLLFSCFIYIFISISCQSYIPNPGDSIIEMNQFCFLSILDNVCGRRVRQKQNLHSCSIYYFWNYLTDHIIFYIAMIFLGRTGSSWKSMKNEDKKLKLWSQEGKHGINYYVILKNKKK